MSRDAPHFIPLSSLNLRGDKGGGSPLGLGGERRRRGVGGGGGQGERGCGPSRRGTHREPKHQQSTEHAGNREEGKLWVARGGERQRGGAATSPAEGMGIRHISRNNSFIRSDIHKHFDNKSRRLRRCESILFPTLEILDKENPKESGHYWLMVLNIKDKRFKVLDSARMLKHKAFHATANKIMEGIEANWEIHYITSSVQIKDWKLHEIKCPKLTHKSPHTSYLFCFFALFI